MDTIDYLKKRLKLRRNAMKLTQTELAIKIGVTENTAKQTISNWERGFSSPDPDMLAKMANVLECSVDYLLGKTDEPAPLKIIDSDFIPESLKPYMDKIKILQKSSISDISPAELLLAIDLIRKIRNPHSDKD